MGGGYEFLFCLRVVGENCGVRVYQSFIMGLFRFSAIARRARIRTERVRRQPHSSHVPLWSRLASATAQIDPVRLLQARDLRVTLVVFLSFRSGILVCRRSIIDIRILMIFMQYQI